MLYCPSADVDWISTDGSYPSRNLGFLVMCGVGDPEFKSTESGDSRTPRCEALKASCCAGIGTELGHAMRIAPASPGLHPAGAITYERAMAPPSGHAHFNLAWFCVLGFGDMQFQHPMPQLRTDLLGVELTAERKRTSIAR